MQTILLINLFTTDGGTSGADRLLTADKQAIGDMQIGASKHVGNHASYNLEISTRVENIVTNNSFSAGEKKILHSMPK